MQECMVNHVKWFKWWKYSSVLIPEYKNYTVSDYYPMYMEWSKHPFVYTTTFEKLVGNKGNGSRECQLHELKNIAQFLGIEPSSSFFKDLFGKSDTFYSGKIGKWKKEFTKEHKALYKEIAGQLLIDLGYEQDLDW